MYESFDAFEYLEYLRRRWRVFAAAIAVALLISLPVSLLLPKRYTAIASIVIEPPGGSDPRIGTAVSAVYLDSLKTYERFASSDSLFARAAQQFHLQTAAGSPSLESLKRSVLKVSKLKDTKILEIDVTLPDAKLAQRVAQFLADETVNMSHGESLASDTAFMQTAEKEVIEAHTRLESVQKALADQAATAPLEGLQSEIDAATQLQSQLRQQLVDAQADIAEYQQQSDQFAREQLAAATSRAALLEKRSQEVAREIQDKSAALSKRQAQKEALQAELKTSQLAYDSDTTRQREMRATAGMHSEQLRVIDPGIVPERPSSPNIPLNVGAALLVALVSSIVYVSFAFAYRRRPVGFEPSVSRGMRV
ncbi:MAG TPA: Wzz/FepE/Etk N-terminal domain-containing protein [Bryobacteraceae bacterium]|nr:Wzz/FepE/Etk N-terminal domain-containing protein [Bryobacteraceae bacterium]